jgi:TM2 domain-containing membrane protein YozV
MNCPNCGRELSDGEVCTCTQQNTAPAAPAEPVAQAPVANEPQPQPQAAPYIPQQNTYEQPQYAPQGEYYQQPNTAAYAVPTYNPNDPAYQQYYAQPVAVAPARCDYPEGYKIKRKYVAVILGFTLGSFGIHNFYLGNSSKALAQLLLSTVGCLFFFLGPIAAAIWALVETVQLLTETIDRDANGFKIQTFEEALVKTRMEAERKLKEEEEK